MLKEEIERLGPWYQPIRFGWGINTRPVDKSGRGHGVWSLDRGLLKWCKFIRPNLPFSLKGKDVVEVGCNAGLFLVQMMRQGAWRVTGIEPDKHYFEQAKFVCEKLGKWGILLSNAKAEDFKPVKTDLVLFLNSIYHIKKQVEVIRKFADISEYLMFQGNPLKDEGKGKGRESLLSLIKEAGLKVYSEKIYNHPRGYILICKK